MPSLGVGRKTSPKKDNKFSLTKRDDLRGLLLNKQGLSDFRFHGPQVQEAEFLYLRENEFHVFNPGLTLNNLKVLDLSQNNITSPINFLHLLPFLRHLYLTGNQLNSFQGFHDLEDLETLCVSNNRISSFEGLGNILPNLRVLSANNNLISDFNFFPFLPSLYQLNLQSNPVCSTPSYRKIAIAVCNDQLTKVDSESVTRKELEDTYSYRGKVAFCISQGFVGNSEGTLQEQADRFLLEKQRETTRQHSLVLQAINLHGSLREGDPITLHVCLQDQRPLNQRQTQKFISHQIFPVELQVQGDAHRVFVVGSMNFWQEPLELERCVDGHSVFFHTTLYLPVGEYEYRYIVDGEEKVSEQTKTLSKFNQGVCNVYKVTGVVPDDIKESRTLLHIRWLRSNCNSGFDLIKDHCSLEYTPGPLDVGSCLRAEVLAYLDANFEALVFDITPPIVCGLPTCTRLELVGQPAEGVPLQVKATYCGGVEGNSSYQWFRVQNKKVTVLEENHSSNTYVPVGDDVGSILKVVYTPIREDGIKGDERSVVSKVVAPSPPQVKMLSLNGQFAEGCNLTIECEYQGGREGISRIFWFREKGNEREVISQATGCRNYIPTSVDVGHCITVEYTPISVDGREGKMSTVSTDTIGAGHPQVINVALQGQCRELTPLNLSFDFVGGKPGKHNIQWFRKIGNSQAPIATSNPMSYVCRSADIGHVVVVRIIPMREDGTQGEPKEVECTEPIAAGPPTILSLNLRYRTGYIVGDMITADTQYCGGKEGATVVKWFRSDESGKNWTLIPDLPTARVRNITAEDQGKKLRCTVTPVRDDGVQGAPSSRETDFIQAA